MLISNLNKLSNRFPRLLKGIKSAKRASSEYKIVDNILIFKGEGDVDIYPFGKNVTSDLIADWAKSIELNVGIAYVLCGFGLGRHINLLLKKAPDNVIFL